MRGQLSTIEYYLSPLSSLFHHRRRYDSSRAKEILLQKKNSFVPWHKSVRDTVLGMVKVGLLSDDDRVPVWARLLGLRRACNWLKRCTNKLLGSDSVKKICY